MKRLTNSTKTKSKSRTFNLDCTCTNGEVLLGIDTPWNATFTAECDPAEGGK